MEGVYDHIQEETYGGENEKSEKENEGNLSQDLQETYRNFAASPLGARIGGFLGTVRKQSETVINEARQEATLAGEEAWKGLSDLRTSLVTHARSMSGGGTDMLSPTSAAAAAAAAGHGVIANDDVPETSRDGGPAAAANTDGTTAPPPTASLPAETDRTPSQTAADSEGFISRFRAEAEKRLKDIQRAEDAADEALLRFGTNIRSFLRDAVTVAPPSEGDDATPGDAGKVLFESKDAEGRKVIHTSRFDAQLHVIHCALESFTRDPSSPEWAKWKEEFNAEGKTEAIAGDLKKYEDLRRAMEKLVPEEVDYETFWSRYYFLRMVIESEEKRRREMLKGAALSGAEEVAWDEDSDSDAEDRSRSTPQPAASTDHLSPPVETGKEARKSQDQASTADSDASYDLVSGATSRAASSPKEEKAGKLGKVNEGKAGEDSDDDWE